MLWSGRERHRRRSAGSRIGIPGPGTVPGPGHSSRNMGRRKKDGNSSKWDGNILRGNRPSSSRLPERSLAVGQALEPVDHRREQSRSTPAAPRLAPTSLTSCAKITVQYCEASTTNKIPTVNRMGFHHEEKFMSCSFGENVVLVCRFRTWTLKV